MEKEEEKLFDASGSYSEGKRIISQEAENAVANVVSYHKKTKHEPATSGHPAGIQACEKQKLCQWSTPSKSYAKTSCKLL